MNTFSTGTKIYILSTILIGSGIVALTAVTQLWQLNWWMIAILSLLASLSLIFKVVGATNRSHYNVSFLLYAFTFVALGVPATILVILVSNIVEWIYHRYPWYIQAFNITSYIIIIHLSGLVYRWINSSQDLLSLTSLVGVLVSLAIFTLLNHLMVGIVVWLARGENLAKSGVFGIFSLMLDYCLLSFGAATAFIWTINPYGIVLSLIPLYLIYSTLKVPALERKSNTDPKTGLYNSEYFSGALKSELARADRFDNPLTVVMGDLDLLRNINNTYGHLAGDIVLIGIANIIKDSIGEYDVVARFGGEEYAILMPETTVEQAYALVEKIRAKIAQAEFSVATSVTPIQATMSFGIAGRKSGSPSLTENDLLHNADVALYHAKLTGRNRAVIYTEEGQNPFETAQNSRQQAEVKNEPPPAMPVESPQPQAVHVQAPSEDSGGETRERPAEEIRHYPSWAVNAFIGLLLVLALGLFFFIYKPEDSVNWIGLFYFGTMVIITEWLSVDIYVRDTSVSTSAAPMLAGFLMFGPVGVAVLSITFAMVALIKHKSYFNRFIFNTSNQMIAGLLSILFVRATTLELSQINPLLQALLVTLAAMVVFITTSMSVAIVMDFSSGVPTNQVWTQKFRWLLPYYLIIGFVAYTLIYSYENMGLIGILVILVPLLMLRFSQEQYISRTKAMVAELQEKNARLEGNSQVISKLNDDLLNALAEAIELRDPYALGHSKHVSLYAAMIAEEMGLPVEQVEIIRKAGLLHDVGKLGVPESILFKPFSLTRDEYFVVKRHAILGTEIIKTCTSLQNLLPIILHHHEHWDGTGYPDQLAGEKIPLAARIVAVADAIEAMASDRPYRKALSLTSIVRELKRYSGIQFDPQVVDAFVSIVEKHGEAVVVNSAQVMSGALPVAQAR